MGENEGVNIHQNSWFGLGNLDKNTQLTYTVKQKGNGVYAFLVEGDATINDIVLSRRDGLGITETDMLTIKADSQAEILLMEVPMS